MAEAVLFAGRGDGWAGAFWVCVYAGEFGDCVCGACVDGGFSVWEFAGDYGGGRVDGVCAAWAEPVGGGGGGDVSADAGGVLRGGVCVVGAGGDCDDGGGDFLCDAVAGGVAVDGGDIFGVEAAYVAGGAGGDTADAAAMEMEG